MAVAKEASSAEHTIITAKMFQGLQISWGHHFSSFQNIKSIIVVVKFWGFKKNQTNENKQTNKHLKKTQTKIKGVLQGNF